MNRLTTLTAATILLAAAGTIATPTAASAATTSTTAAPPVVRVLPLGDSITYGRNSCTGNGYRGPLQNLVAAEGRFAVDYVGSQQNGVMADPANEGHPGDTVDQISAGIDGWLAATHPDVVLLHIGVNDLNQYASGSDTAAKATQLVDRIFADQPGVTVIMQGLIPTTYGMNSPLPDMSGNIPAYNSALQRLEATEQQAGKHFRYVAAPALVPYDHGTATQPAQMSDGLHPNDAGYALLGQNFLAPLDQAYDVGWFTGGAAQSPQPANTVHLVNLAPDASLHNTEGDYSAGTWNGWSDLGASGIKEVTSAHTFSVNRIFTIGRDGQVYEKDGDYGSRQWSGWFRPSIGTLPSPAVAITASSHNHTVHLAVVGADGHLYNSDGDYEAGRWNGWTDHGGGFKRVASASTADNVNHIFAIDSNNRVQEIDADYCAGTWSGWAPAGSSAFTARDVAASASGDTVHLSAVALDGSWSNTDGNFDTGQWNGWFKMSGSGFKRIASAAANNVNHIFAVDGSNRLQEIDGDYNTGHWSSWAPAAGGADAIGATATFTR
ncbi:GDSL-type esterase/lipase family protein [Streptomyces sp. NPDC101160]|uniref:GDSL-type esterase/lipase family protein n=1 Tax=Streptomyces sp. NPDC101160 TaxID=3366118 RepID=UPI00381CB893